MKKSLFTYAAVLLVFGLGMVAGILSSRSFTMLVIMALVTTCLTGPLLTLADYLRARRTLAVHST
jgi:predicted PurR-regulated permease PerM